MTQIRTLSGFQTLVGKGATLEILESSTESRFVEVETIETKPVHSENGCGTESHVIINGTELLVFSSSGRIDYPTIYLGE